MPGVRKALDDYAESIGATPRRKVSNTTTTSSGGIGLFGLTFVVLLVLKLTGLASISWFIVFLPLIIAFGLFILLLGIAFLVVFFSD